MELPRKENSSLTESQQKAVAARGNVLVMAGAGTGKTKTLVARCLDCLDRDGAEIDELLIVTFTEAAAAEMRLRLRKSLEEKTAAQPDGEFWQEQIARFDLAHIGTLHSFCLKLVREHFYELGLDPQISILDEGQTRLLADETLDEQFQSHYENEDAFSLAVQALIKIYGNGHDEKIRALILRLHHYVQTRADAENWLARQIENFSNPEPAQWRKWFSEAVSDWRAEWLLVLENLKNENEKAAELAGILLRLGSARETTAEILEQIISADDNWPAKRKTILRKPLEDLFADAKFLFSLAPVKNGNDPLAEDWDWIRGHMKTLLELAREFAGKFFARKRADGVLDFHDLEQFTLKLLWNFETEKPTAIAELWREKLRFVFVDEYQDINAAQDKIIAALARDDFFSPSPRPSGERAGVRGIETKSLLTPPLSSKGGEGEKTYANRFLVGDVKQSIYRFRLADPKIFRDYAKNWHRENNQSGQTIPLSENFRSHESLLDFVNSLFSLVMREAIGDVNYDANAELKFGKQMDTNQNGGRPQGPRTELLLRFKKNRNAQSDSENENDLSDLDDAETEARLLALRLLELKNSGHEIWDDDEKKIRAVKWRDLAILLRSPRGKSEIYAKEFERAGVPLAVAPGGFYDSSEILDLLSLLELLDNPLQDVPCIAVLRSPLVGCSLDELAEIRLAAGGYFWFAVNAIQNSKLKIKNFLERFSRWRKIAKQVSLSQCLEEILAETHYTDWLKAQPRGAQRSANVAQLLQLAQSFDQFQRQGLFRFLKFIVAQREIEIEPEVPAVASENAVRLMSIHQSKGLEFPVVVVADLAKNFNEQDLRGEIILDEQFGLCPRVKPPNVGGRYPSLAYWLAQKNQRRELRGEELRLLYVTLTRARDSLILTASISEKKWETVWTKPEPVTPQKIAGAKSFADWLAIWFSAQNPKPETRNETEGELENLRWRIVNDAELVNRWGETPSEPPLENSQDGSRGRSPHQMESLDEAALEKLRAVLSWNYPHEAATRRKAKSSVTELRRAAEESDDEAEQIFAPKFRKPRLAGTLAPPKTKLNAAEIGAAHHRFLQHVALDKTGDLKTEAERLVHENFLSAEESAALDLDALAQFWNSELGQKISAQPPDWVKHELPFTARFSPAEIAEITGGKTEAGLENEFVVVQGVADLVVLLPQEIWLVDFKTDEIRVDELPEKIQTYKPQLQFYAAALEKIFARQVTLCALHFLTTRKTVEI